MEELEDPKSVSGGDWFDVAAGTAFAAAVVGSGGLFAVACAIGAAAWSPF